MDLIPNRLLSSRFAALLPRVGNLPMRKYLVYKENPPFSNAQQT
jgi:hypothetical protein